MRRTALALSLIQVLAFSAAPLAADEPSWPERVQALAFGPDDTVYAGTDAQGFWKSTDAGRTWRPTSQEGLPAGAQVAALAVDPRDARIVYAGLPVPRRSLFNSTDGGATWKPSQRPGQLVVDLEATGYGLLAALPIGVYLSPDRGLTWRPRNNGLAPVSDQED